MINNISFLGHVIVSNPNIKLSDTARVALEHCACENNADVFVQGKEVYENGAEEYFVEIDTENGISWLDTINVGHFDTTI